MEVWTQRLQQLLKNIMFKKRYAENVMLHYQLKLLIVERENAVTAIKSDLKRNQRIDQVKKIFKFAHLVY